MKITIKLHLTLEKYSNCSILSKTDSIAVPHFCRIQDLINLIGIPTSEIGIILVNGLLASISTELKENDSVDLFPFIDGG